MIPRRRNFLSAGSYKKRVTGDPVDMYTQWHWGVKPKGTPLNVDDEDLPNVLIECGRLVEFTYRSPQQNPKHKDKLYKLTKNDANKTHLVFDPEHPNDRLYIVSISEKVDDKFAKKFYKDNPHIDCSLIDMSEYIGGRHSGNDYPDVDARAVGILTSIVYACEKKGDGYSFYVHKMGEETGVQPIIACSEDGRLWIVGGNYTAPRQGITD